MREGGKPPTKQELSYLRELYDAQIRYWDAQLATLLEGLSAAGVGEQTVLVITSDHGEEFLEHGGLGHGNHLYDELVRVPLVMVGPNVGTARVAQQAQGIDIYPTVAGILGSRVPPGLPGRNLLADRSSRAAVSENRCGMLPDGTWTEVVSLRTPVWKLVHAPAMDSFELYDLNRDPGERNNVYREGGEGDLLARQLAEWRASVPLPPEVAGRDPELREKLRALGYID
jgi:arylsulfatase A-like enzyme